MPRYNTRLQRTPNRLTCWLDVNRWIAPRATPTLVLCTKVAGLADAGWTPIPGVVGGASFLAAGSGDWSRVLNGAPSPYLGSRDGIVQPLAAAPLAHGVFGGYAEANLSGAGLVLDGLVVSEAAAVADVTVAGFRQAMWREGARVRLYGAPIPGVTEATLQIRQDAEQLRLWAGYVAYRCTTTGRVVLHPADNLHGWEILPPGPAVFGVDVMFEPTTGAMHVCYALDADETDQREVVVDLASARIWLGDGDEPHVQ